MITRRAVAVFDLANYESTTISKKTLCELQDCEAQERRARDLQKPAPQTKARVTLFNDLVIYRFNVVTF